MVEPNTHEEPRNIMNLLMFRHEVNAYTRLFLTGRWKTRKKIWTKQMGNKYATLFLNFEDIVKVKVSRTINWVEHMKVYLFYWKFLVILKPFFMELGTIFVISRSHWNFELIWLMVILKPHHCFGWLVVILKPPLDSLWALW